MADLDTKIDGSPGSIRAVGGALKGDFGAGAGAMADAAFHGHQVSSSAWDAQGGAAFAERAKELARAADTAQRSALVAERNIDALAHALDTAQTEMAQVRANAAAAGLTVAGDVIRDPGVPLEIDPPSRPAGLPPELRWCRSG